MSRMTQMWRPPLNLQTDVGLVQVEQNYVGAKLGLVRTRPILGGCCRFVVLAQALETVFQILFVDLEVEHLRGLIAETVGAQNVKPGALFNDEDTA